jgi:hypothetical protein
MDGQTRGEHAGCQRYRDDRNKRHCEESKATKQSRLLPR